jgi:hypothetical protein
MERTVVFMYVKHNYQDQTEASAGGKEVDGRTQSKAECRDRASEYFVRLSAAGEGPGQGWFLSLPPHPQRSDDSS